MWKPNTVSVPTEMIHAEIRGTVPTGTTLATAAFLIDSSAMQNPKTEAGRIAKAFLETGNLVTMDGEILEPEDESPSTEVAPPSPSESNSIDLEALYREKFSDFPEPTAEQWQMLWDLSKQDAEWLQAVFVILEDSILKGGDVKSVIAVSSWNLRNVPRQETLNKAAAIARKGHTGTSLVRDVMRKAESEIRSMPKPTPDEKHLERLRKMKESMGG